MGGRPKLTEEQRRSRDLKAANQRLAREANRRRARAPRVLDLFPVWREEAPRDRCKICGLERPHVCLDGSES